MRKLTRSASDKKLSGVLGGIAEYLQVDSSILRILYVIGTLMYAVVPGLLLYIIMLFIIPIKQE